jgi:hypothetical protein
LSDSGSQLSVRSLRLYWDILRLRKGPEDLPVSLSLLVATVVLRIAAGLIIARLVPEPDAHSMALVCIDTGVVLLWGRVLLHAAGRPERYLQTLSAVFGCELVLQPLLAPAAWFYAVYGKEPNFGLLAVMVLFALELWALVAVVRVLRSATGWATFICVAVAISQELVTLMVAFALMPDLARS